MPSRHRIATLLRPAPSRSLGILLQVSAGSASESLPLPTPAGSDVLAAMTGSPINVSPDGSVVVIAVERCLDQSTGEALIEAATAAIATGPSRLDIDLQGLESFTDDGARALAACGTLGSQLPAGLHYR